MNGGIVFRNGGPIGWRGKRQERTSLSLCKAKIRATNATSKKVMDFWNPSHSVSENGHTLNNINSPTIFYNNNDACMKWSHNTTSKSARHIKLHENSVCEWVQDNTLNMVNIAGKVNPANISAKEMSTVLTSIV
jgi:hypothetical protein